MTKPFDGEKTYSSPKLFRIGDVSDLTFGQGTIYGDTLGNPQTSYGKGPASNIGLGHHIAGGLAAGWRRLRRAFK